MNASSQRLPRWKINLFWTLFVSSLILGSIELLNKSGAVPGLFPSNSEMNDYSKEEALRLSVYRVLFDFGIRVDWITGDSRSKTVLVPNDLPMVAPYIALTGKFRELGGTLIKAESNSAGDRMTIEVALQKEPLFRVTLLKDPELERNAGKIAIVIDDFGYSFGSQVEAFLNLNQEITFAILPGLPYSRKIAQAAVDGNRQAILHLPMEAKKDDVGFDGFTLHTRLPKEEIRARLRKSIKAVPHIVGLSNHMGSLATEDARLLRVMMEEVKKTGLFFLDSHTGPGTLAYATARGMAIPCAINDAFLDRIPEEPFIREQVYLLAEMASRRGYAIGIGHPKKMTLKVLQKELPVLARRGYQFVGVSELIEKKQMTRK
ncbi:MAG: divergent polysaccharide deacetylase family protein [bacterium]